MINLPLIKLKTGLWKKRQETKAVIVFFMCDSSVYVLFFNIRTSIIYHIVKARNKRKTAVNTQYTVLHEKLFTRGEQIGKSHNGARVQ